MTSKKKRTRKPTTPNPPRIEAEAQRAAQAVREKHRKEKLRQQHRKKEFYATHPHLKPSDENADKPLNSRPAANVDTSPQPAPKSASSTPQLPATKKPPYPTQKEFDQDIDALTRKHFFPNMPDEIYKKAKGKS